MCEFPVVRRLLLYIPTCEGWIPHYCLSYQGSILLSINIQEEFLLFQQYMLLPGTILWVQVQWKRPFTIFHYAPVFLSRLCAAVEDVQHGMLVFLPMASVQQIAMQEQFQLLSSNSADIRTRTVVLIQEIIWVLAWRTGPPTLVQVTIRYKFYRYLINETFPLNESATEPLRKQLEQVFSRLWRHHKVHVLYKALTCM